MFGSTIGNNIDEVTKASNVSERKNILVRPETICTLTGYINPITNNSQGVGSGAGYIEISNGIYTLDPSLN